MSAAGHSEDSPDRVAAALRDADFVRLVATADGDALAATGLLARALAASEVPYQASLAAVPDVPATDADCTVGIGHTSTADVALEDSPLSIAAADIVRDIAPDALDSTLALAGAVCDGATPSGALLESTGLERRPGVALPTDDRLDGLAGSTLVHAAFSGAEAALEDELENVDVGDGRELASFVALSVVEDAPPRAAEAVERALYPYECDRFETLGGFADVLDAVARERPGTGIALTLGNAVESAALETWRAHGQRVHSALRDANTGRYDGVSVARLGHRERASGHTHEDPAPRLGAVARLLFEYRALEPVALVVTDGAAAIAAETDTEAAFRAATASLDGRATARTSHGTAAFHGTATFDGTATDYVAAFREAI